MQIQPVNTGHHIVMPLHYRCFRGKFSTPRGTKYLSVRAANIEIATIILRNKTPYRAGWYLVSVA